MPYFNAYGVLMQDDELQHHGILGMHWGIRRFQPYPKGFKKGKEVGEAKEAAKNRLKDAKRKYDAGKYKKEDVEAVKKENKAAIKEAKKKDKEALYEARKAQDLRSASASEILEKYQGKLTNDELKEVTVRLGYEKKLKDFRADDLQKGQDAFDKAMNTLSKVSSGLKTVNDFRKELDTFRKGPDGKGGNKDKQEKQPKNNKQSKQDAKDEKGTTLKDLTEQMDNSKDKTIYDAEYKELNPRPRMASHEKIMELSKRASELETPYQYKRRVAKERREAKAELARQQEEAARIEEEKKRKKIKQRQDEARAALIEKGWIL